MTGTDGGAGVVARPETSGAAGGIRRRGVLVVLSSPSGAGKTTLGKRLLASDATIKMSVSVTTRTPRPGEIDGRDYHFIDVAAFTAMRDSGQLIEWAPVFDNFYGTPRAPVEASLAAGGDVLFDIEWQGARQLAAAMPEDLVRVFILPPSAAALERRLKTRAQDSDAIVAKRMAGAATEISHWNEYDYVIVNDDMEASVAALLAIIGAERARRVRQPGLQGFVDELLGSL